MRLTMLPCHVKLIVYNIDFIYSEFMQAEKLRQNTVYHQNYCYCADWYIQLRCYDFLRNNNFSTVQMFEKR